MKIGVLTNAFREKRFVPGAIKQFQPWGLRHVVLAGTQPWHGHWPQDDTARVAREMGAEVFEGQWPTEASQFNFGLDHFDGCDWVIICDADERYEAKDIRLLLGELMRSRDNVGAIRSNKMDVYWKTPDYKIVPDQTDYPLIAIRPRERFTHMRATNASIGWTDAKMHHLSYVRRDNEMLKKIESFSEVTNFDPHWWFENVWLPWTPDSENLHPVVPEQFKRAVFNPLPDSLWEYVT